MKIHRIAIALAGLTIASAASAATDWTQHVEISPVGGHVLGNPKAATRLVEYVSYTCPHCAHYAEEAAPALKPRYIASGKVSVEVRNYLRDPVDLTAALLARCGPKAKFFGNHEALMAGQDKWLPAIVNTPRAEQERWYEGPYLARFQKIAARAGFYTLMQKRGIGRQAADKCLASEPARNLLSAMTAAGANEYKISGTPSFLINNTLLTGVHSWQQLKPRLEQDRQ